MATYGEIVTNVLDVVPRPDKEELIRNKINQAIRFISNSGYFWRDIVESTIGVSEGLDADANIQAIPITSTTRKMIYIQYPDTDETTKFTLLELASAVKRQNCALLSDIGYLSGSNLHIRNSILTSTLNIGYYTNPANFATDESEDDDTNWILDLAPGLVEDVAAAYILNLIGDNEDSKNISNLASIMRSTYIKDFMDSVGVA